MAPQRKLRRSIVYLGFAGLVSGMAWWGWPTSASPELPVATTVQAAEPLPSVPGPPAAPEPMVPQSAAERPNLKVRTYVVEAGDTIDSIAARLDLKPDTILLSNRISDERLLQVGQELAIPAIDGLLHTVTEGDTFWDVASLYSVDTDVIILANPDLSPDTLQPGQRLLVPGATPPKRSNQVVSRSGSRPTAPEGAAPPASESLLWPLSGPITDYFGWRTHPVYGTQNFHEGIDIAVPADTPVRAVAAGTVTLAEWYGGYGLTVRINHGAGLVSRYSHNAVLLASPGDIVEAGQVIARSGNTGVSTGPHLDFGLYLGGKPVDPLSRLPR